MPNRQAKLPGKVGCTIRHHGAWTIPPPAELSLPSSQPIAPVLGADFRARFTATVPGNQACSVQTKGEEIAWANRASSCRATVSSMQGCAGLRWSVTREQCDRSHFTGLPSKKKKALLYCWAAGTDLLERKSRPAPVFSKLDHCPYKTEGASPRAQKHRAENIDRLSVRSSEPGSQQRFYTG